MNDRFSAFGTGTLEEQEMEIRQTNGQQKRRHIHSTGLVLGGVLCPICPTPVSE